LVTVRFTSEAIKRLRAEKEAKLLFHYPKHASAAVRIIAAEGTVTEPDEQ
jgi:hypothetical protein